MRGFDGNCEFWPIEWIWDSVGGYPNLNLADGVILQFARNAIFVDYLAVEFVENNVPHKICNVGYKVIQSLGLEIVTTT